MLLNQQMRLSGLTSPPAPATLFDAERGDRKLARVWRKNKIVGNHPILVSSLDTVPDLDKYGVRAVVLYR